MGRLCLITLFSRRISAGVQVFAIASPRLLRGNAVVASRSGAAMQAGTAELKWILTDNDVSEDVQAVMFYLGMTKMFHLCTICSDEAECWTMVKDSLGVDQASDFPSRLIVGSVVNAWLASKKQRAKYDELAAEAKATGVVRQITSGEYTSLKKAAEQVIPRMEADEVPSRPYVSKMFAEIVNDEPTAHALNEVTANDDAVIKLSQKGGRIPRGTEELRKWHRRMANAYLNGKLKHTNRPWLSDWDVDVMRLLTDYLVGSQVAGLEAKSKDGAQVMPSWSCILIYEREIRKAAAAAVVDGEMTPGEGGDPPTMATAIKKKMKDVELRQTYLLQPFTLELNGHRTN